MQTLKQPIKHFAHFQKKKKKEKEFYELFGYAKTISKLLTYCRGVLIGRLLCPEEFL